VHPCTGTEALRGQRHAPAGIYPRERPGTHCTGGWVGPRAGLDRCWKSRPPPGFDSRTVQPEPVAISTTLPGSQPTLLQDKISRIFLEWLRTPEFLVRIRGKWVSRLTLDWIRTGTWRPRFSVTESLLAPIPMAARSKVWFYGRSLAGIAG
jgi:hypothetical protein